MSVSETNVVRRASLARRWVRVSASVAMVGGSLAAAPIASSPASAQSPKPSQPHISQRHYPHLPADIAAPGHVILAFKGAVDTAGGRVTRSHDSSATSADVSSLNNTLTSLGATKITHLLANLPVDKLNAARATAEAATGGSLTDFTQLYQVDFSPAANAGDAANALASSKLVTSAMPDFVLHTPVLDKATLSPAQVASAVAAVQAAKSAPQGSPTAAGLPTSSAYVSDAQSYLDAASDNVTGAAAMIAKQFGQQPGQGENVTNISLGNLDSTSTVLVGGQRYLEQAGFPKIPVWLSSLNCDPSNNCTVNLDPTATTHDDQGDLLEVMLDFSVMAPPPVGDPRIVNPAPAGLGQILGEAYGANFRLINPLDNTTPNFLAAFLGSVFLQSPPADVVTASIGSGFGIGGFSDYFFEQEAIIHDAVTELVQGANTFVSISAGDGQTETSVAMNPNGLTGPTDITKNPNKITDIDDPTAWANPNYSYGLTVEPEYVIDSGANDAGGDTLNDVYNNAPGNFLISPNVSHDQHTTETRWTGQQNFHTGSGSRVTVSAPADNVLILAQVEDPNTGIPVSPVATFPRLLGGTSASAPEIAGGAAVIRQAARLLGINLGAKQVRDLLQATGRDTVTPGFDLSNANIGPAYDLTAAVQWLFDRAHVHSAPSFARMTVAERKGVLTYTDFRSSFWTDTTQNPVAGTATVDLSQGLVAPSGRTNETVGASGDNLDSPITFGVDAMFQSSLNLSWSLSIGNQTVNVPGFFFSGNEPYLRLLPAEIFGLLGQPLTSTSDRVVTVTARNGSAAIATKVTFKGQASASHAHPVPPVFNPVYYGGNLTVAYDFRGVPGANGGELVVSDIDRAVPQAFPGPDGDVHGFIKHVNGLVGTVTLHASDFPHGVGTYGLAVRATHNGAELADTTSFFLPLRYAPLDGQMPATPKIQAVDSLLNGTAPLFYDIADTEADGGSTSFGVTYDVSNVIGAKGAIIEFSAPTLDFASGLYFTGAFDGGLFVNNFTNPNGDRLDSGDNFGQPGETTHVVVNGKQGTAMLDGAAIGLNIPAGHCDSTYQVRVFATDAHGHIIGVAGNGSIFSYGDFSQPSCFPPSSP